MKQEEDQEIQGNIAPILPNVQVLSPAEFLNTLINLVGQSGMSYEELMDLESVPRSAKPESILALPVSIHSKNSNTEQCNALRSTEDCAEYIFLFNSSPNF